MARTRSLRPQITRRGESIETLVNSIVRKLQRANMPTEASVFAEDAQRILEHAMTEIETSAKRFVDMR